jgi:hypothetical protein
VEGRRSNEVAAGMVAAKTAIPKISPQRKSGKGGSIGEAKVGVGRAGKGNLRSPGKDLSRKSVRTGKHESGREPGGNQSEKGVAQDQPGEDKEDPYRWDTHKLSYRFVSTRGRMSLQFQQSLPLPDHGVWPH